MAKKKGSRSNQLGGASGSTRPLREDGAPAGQRGSSKPDLTPENTIKEGLKMVAAFDKCLEQLTIKNEERDQVWKADREALRKFKDKPSTLIAICGGTGAGKSSLINAVLEDNIVPTSGMQACTSVVTKISYHKSKEIRAEVIFLSKHEWEQELRVVLRDLEDDRGPRGSKVTTDEAKIAWDKVRAVYPNLSVDELLDMEIQHILDHDQDVLKKLGTTEVVTAKDSKNFGEQIAKYIESADHNGSEDKTAALWPLIREVHVFCKAKALSTGAVLVDLPGTADANAARDSIAKKYLKDAKRIWIVAAITRAVDDQLAKNLLGENFRRQLFNGSYNVHAITFVATKTDDIANSEMTRHTDVENTRPYKLIEARLEEILARQDKIQEEKNELAKRLKVVGSEMDQLEARQAEIATRLEAIGRGEPLSQLTLEYPPDDGASSSNALTVSKKRKQEGPSSDEAGPSKRTRQAANEGAGHRLWETISVDSDSDSDDSDDELDAIGEDVDMEDVEEASFDPSEIQLITDPALLLDMSESIKEQLAHLQPQKDAMFQEGNALMEAGREVHEEYEAAHREKTVLCSLARNRVSRQRLQDDFRAGLKEMDDVIELERNPLNFDHTQNLKDYSTMTLPVFACSSRDFIRMRGQVEGDGDASCFLNEEDTGIPALQQWCHELTLPARQQAEKDFVQQLTAFTKSIKAYVEHIQDYRVSALNRMTLQHKWDSKLAIHTGIAPRLRKEFTDLTNQCTSDLKQNFKNNLQEKCEEGVRMAAEAAVDTVDEFSKIHHCSYRATIRRYGEWKRDFNAELIDPFTKTIAASFHAAFREHILGRFEVDVRNHLATLLREFQASAADQELAGAATVQGKVCREEVKAALQRAMDTVKETLTSERKTISRSTSPIVRKQLYPSYDAAQVEKGKGAVARQKAHIRNFVVANKDTMFREAGETILTALDDVAALVGNILYDKLEALADKIEITLAVLWEDVHTSPDEEKAREHAVVLADEVLKRMDEWRTTTLKEEEDHDVDPFNR